MNGLDLSGSELGSMAGSCEYGEKSSVVFFKDGEFLDYLGYCGLMKDLFVGFS
jgi:hypothetical protein